jgi:hypothetical protein
MKRKTGKGEPALLCLIVMGFMASSALATTTYYYTGNPFNDFRNGGVCPPTCSVTGSFTVATPLAPNLPLTLITPISFSLSAGLTTLVDGDPANTSLEVSTDASGGISTWSWVVLGPEASISARILTQNLPGLVFDSVHFGDNAPPFQGFAGPLVAEVLNDPGTWSFVPEPSYPILVGMIVLVVIRGIRKQRQSPRHADWPPAVRSSDAV